MFFLMFTKAEFCLGFLITLAGFMVTDTYGKSPLTIFLSFFLCIAGAILLMHSMVRDVRERTK
jgi:hypothetical protein